MKGPRPRSFLLRRVYPQRYLLARIPAPIVAPASVGGTLKKKGERDEEIYPAPLTSGIGLDPGAGRRRGQAQNETSIAIDPMNTNHLIATSNDYRRGDGNCFSEYSLDKGRTWNDTSIPMA